MFMFVFLQRHRGNLKKHPNDSTRCDNRKATLPVVTPTAVVSGDATDSSEFDFILSDSPLNHPSPLQEPPITLPALEEPLPEVPVIHDPLPEAPEVSVIHEAMPLTDLSSVVRRCPAWLPANQELITRTRLVVKKAFDTTAMTPRDMIRKQRAWETYTLRVYHSCTPVFWSFFLPMRTLSATAIDTALTAATTTFLKQNMPPNFPLSKRGLINKISTVPSF